jgi:hypothetical protein
MRRCPRILRREARAGATRAREIFCLWVEDGRRAGVLLVCGRRTPRSSETHESPHCGVSSAKQPRLTKPAYPASPPSVWAFLRCLALHEICGAVLGQWRSKDLKADSVITSIDRP